MKGKKLTYKERVSKLESDSIERRRVFKLLLDHVARGYSIESFSELSPNSIKSYLNLFKEEFVQEELEEAQRLGRQAWEDIGYKQANGQCLGNSRTWFYNMSNRYGWRDKIEVEAEHKGQVSVNVISYATSKPSTDTLEEA